MTNKVLQASRKYFGWFKQWKNADFAVHLFCAFFAKRQIGLERYKTLTSHKYIAENQTNSHTADTA